MFAPLKALALAGSLFASVVGGVPAFPYHQYAEVTASQTGVACEGEVADLRTADGEYRILSNKDKDIFIHITNGEADYVYFIEGTKETGMHVKLALSVAEAMSRYPTGPCAYFTGVEI